MAGLSASTLFGLSVLLFVSFIVGELFERIGLESILGYILTGLFLGPSFLGMVEPGAVQSFATIGATLVLFQAGLREENAADIFRHRKGLQLGIGVLVVSFLFILGFLYFIGGQYLPFNTMEQFIFLALAYAVVDVGVPSKIMLSRGMLREETGRYAIKASVINVTAGLLALTGLVLVSSSMESLIVRLGGILGFAVAFYILHEFIHRLDDYIIMFEEAESQFAITFALLLGLSYMSEVIGLSSVLGAFFAGIIVSRSDFSESEAFQEKIRGIGLGFFIPVFFAWFGLGLNITSMIQNFQAAAILFTLSTVSKLTMGYIIPKLHGMGHPLTIGASLLSLDIETLVVLLIGLDMGIFSEQVLQIFAPAVFLSTLTIVLLYALIDRVN